jgi:hypothetical protein
MLFAAKAACTTNSQILKAEYFFFLSNLRPVSGLALKKEREGK